MSIRWYTVVIDCRDVAVQSRWWSQVLDWRIAYEAADEVVVVSRRTPSTRIVTSHPRSAARG